MAEALSNPSAANFGWPPLGRYSGSSQKTGFMWDLRLPVAGNHWVLKEL